MSTVPTRPCLLPTLVATSLGFAVVQLDVTVVNLALARMGAALGTGMAGLQWVVDAYALAFASLLLTAGALGDRFGARRGLARRCLDWTERRHHLAGPLGVRLLARFGEFRWVRRDAGSRAVHLTPAGAQALYARLGIDTAGLLAGDPA